MNNQEAIDRTMRALGHGTVDVELTPQHMTDALQDAFRWFNDRRGLRAEAAIMLVSGQSEYDMSTIQPVVESVLDVSFPKATDIDLRAIYGDDLALPGVPWGMFPYGALQGGVYSSLVQALQYRKTASKIISSDLDWSFSRTMDAQNPSNPPRVILRITPGVSGPAGQCVVTYKARLTDFVYLAYNDRDEGFVLRRLVAEAKDRLGRIRSKFKSMPAAKGERQMDGDDLLRESAEEKLKIDQDMSDAYLLPAFITA